MTTTRTRASSGRVEGDDHYGVLGVAADASAEEIAAAFRLRAKELHPDLAGGDAEAFRSLRSAFDVLGDPVRRRDYDQRRSGPRRDLLVRPSGPPRPSRSEAAARPLDARRARLVVVAGVVCTVLGVGVAVMAAVLVRASAEFRSQSVAVTAQVVDGSAGREVRFLTRTGEQVQVPEPQRSNAGLRDDTVEIRYRRSDPTSVRFDESTAARDITIAIVAAKLVIGGPVLIAYAMRRRHGGAAQVTSCQFS